MILSILDTDLYKFTTSYAYQKLYPEAEGTFTFTDRNKTVYSDDFVLQLDMELAKLGQIKMTDSEFKWLEKGAIRYIPNSYWEWLYGYFRFEPSKVDVWLDDEKHLHIEVTDKLYKVTLYEVPILAIVSELRNKFFGYNANRENKPANIVMKLSKCRMSPREDWQKCIKVSDDIGKHMGDEKEFEVCTYSLNIPVKK